MSDKSYKQISYGIGAIFIVFFFGFAVYDILFRPETAVPVTPPGSGWVIQPLIDSLLISFAGLTFVILGIVNTIVAWTRTADEYVELLSSMSIGGLGKRWFSAFPSGYWLWQNRLITPFMSLMGLFIFVGGMYSLLRHFF